MAKTRKVDKSKVSKASGRSLQSLDSGKAGEVEGAKRVAARTPGRVGSGLDVSLASVFGVPIIASDEGTPDPRP